MAYLHEMNSSKHELLSLEAFVDRISALTPHLCRSMMRQETTCLSRGEITVPQIWALEIIAERDQCPQQAVLDLLHLKASTGTVFVDRLSRKGWVRRDRNPENRREVALHITRKGLALVHEARAQRKRAFQLLFKPLPASQRGVYLRLLHEMIDNFSTETGTRK